MTRGDESKLGDFIDVVNGYAFKSSDFLNKEEDGCLPVVKIKNVASGTVILADTQYHKLNENLSKYIINKNDILIALTGNHPQAITQVVGEVARYNFDKRSLLNQRVAKVVPKENIDNDYLYYFLKDDTIHDYLASQSSGSGNQANISKKDIENIIFNPPNLTKQKAIASVLSSLDNKIDLLNRQNKTLEAMAEALFKDFFIVNEKEEWENCLIEDLCDSISSGGTPSTKQPLFYNGNINWYSTKELNDSFLFESINKITNEGLNNSSAKLYPINTVVMAIYAAPTVGRLGILANIGAFNQAACGLVANEECCCYEFLYLYLKSQRNELNSLASGSAQQNLNVQKIKKYPVFKAPHSIMQNFKMNVRPPFVKIKANQQQIITLTKLRDTLLPKLMSGEVRVKM